MTERISKQVDNIRAGNWGGRGLEKQGRGRRVKRGKGREQGAQGREDWRREAWRGREGEMKERGISPPRSFLKVGAYAADTASDAWSHYYWSHGTRRRGVPEVVHATCAD